MSAHFEPLDWRLFAVGLALDTRRGWFALYLGPTALYVHWR